MRRKQLARRGVEQGREAGGGDVVIALHCDGADASLAALLNAVGDGEGSGARCGRRGGGGRRGGAIGRAGLRGTCFWSDFYGGEAIVSVNGFERSYIGGDQSLTVSAVTVERIGSVNAEQLLEGGGVEVVVAGNGDALHAAAGSQVHLEDDHNLLFVGGALIVAHFHVKVTEALEVVAEAAIALIEQVLIDAAFLKDGDDVFDAVGRDACPLDQHFDHGAPVGGKAEIDFFGGGVVFRGDDLDFGLHPLLCLVVLQDAGESAIAGVVIDVTAEPEVRIPPELLHAHSGVA